MSDAHDIAKGLSDAQVHILRHSLGVPEGGGEDMYRNHFCTGEGSTDWPDCMALTARGYMTRRAGNPITGGDDVFFVSEKGKETVRAILEQQP